jgi:hypothetical protein
VKVSDTFDGGGPRRCLTDTFDAAAGALTLEGLEITGERRSPRVWRAIISSSLVGMTYAATRLLLALIRGPPLALAAASRVRPNHPAFWITRSRMSTACSPMPAVNTSASRPPSAATSEPSSRPIR